MPRVRLPSHIKPERYNLTLKPDLESFTFAGKEIIDIAINKKVKSITLHSKDIKIETAEIISGKSAQFADKIIYDDKAETATFIFKKIINKGKAKLSIVFEGIINDHLRGFYRSRYTLDGKIKHLATTQFEATDARRAFPCFDEPAHKAIFDVSLIIPGSHTAISNTLPIKISEHEPARPHDSSGAGGSGYKVVEFASTPRMSTYLLAFIIGEFEYVEGFANITPKSDLGGPRTFSPDHPKSLFGSIHQAKPESKFSVSGEPTRGPENLLSGEASDIQVRVFTTQGKSHQAKFALEVAIKAIEFYNDYFDIPYPLPVLDLIAIPDFESSAMENWGAVTFRETAILVDEEKSSLSNKQWVAIVIAHELAHQWFGNLVTMEWWTDLWLNEGFASYMENFCTDNIFPHWHVWDLYLADRYSTALRLDSLANSHPIEVLVHHPNEINEIFDMVSYAKGSAIIRQLGGYLGYEKFRDGLRHYLKKHSYKNTETSDLWESFEKISGKPVKKIMKSWTKKTGYPLIFVSQNKNGYSLKQERFFSSRISAKKNKQETIWQIPISYSNEKILMTSKTAQIKNKLLGKLNKGEKSFIRVRYDAESLNMLKNEIKKSLMPIHDRLGIIRDLFALSEGGYIKTSEALEFSLSCKDEQKYIVWSEIAQGINKIYNIIADEPYAYLYKKYACSLFSPLAEKMTWEKHGDEEHSQTFLRNLAIAQAAFYGDKKIINEAKELFKDRGQISANLRSVIYNIVTSNGDTEEWLKFEEMYKKEALHEEKERYGRALSQFKDKILLERTLKFAMSGNVRMQDAPFLIGGVWHNINGREIAWKFIKQNWKEIVKKYGEGGHFLSLLLSPLGNHIKAKDVEDSKKFFKNHVAPGADRTLEQSYERIYSNSAWLKDDRKDIQNWLEKNFLKS